LLQKGLSPEEVLRVFAAIDPDWDSRQVGIVDAQGRTATWTGKKCLDWAGGESGEGFVCQGNILAGPAVVANMASAFKESKGELAERLIKALEAGQAAGGDKRGMQSASLLIVRPSATNPEYRERYLDLRVEDHKEPIKELRRLWQIAEGFHMAGRHMQIAKQYEAMGKPELARIERERVGDSLKRALDRQEKDAGMLNGLAWECATHDLFLPQALEAAERAVMLEPRNVDIIDTLAEVHFRMGNADKAIEVETRALQIDANSQYLKDQIERFRKKKQ
jgi:tetratricopeptide (TPR) repeat protein